MWMSLQHLPAVCPLWGGFLFLAVASVAELMGHPCSGLGQVFSSLGSAVLVIHQIRGGGRS